VAAQSEPQSSPTSIASDQPSTVDATIIAAVNSGSKRLRVRSGPGTTFAIEARLDNGQRVPVLARNREGSWLLVLAPPDTYGWISTTYVSLNVPLDQVPVAGVPVDAAPTPLPTPRDQEQISTPQTISTPAPAVPPPAGTLAVPVFDAQQRTYGVWLVDADGTNLRKVVDEASTPALSYDGSMLAYRNWQRDDRGIVVARSDGNDPLRITDKLEDVLPSFSPDGTKVALSSYRWGDRKNRLYYAWTDNEDQIAWEWGEGGIFGEDPYWMANGRILYRVTRRDTEAEELWSMSSIDGQDRQLLYSADSIRAPAAAFNSRWVTFMAADNGNWDIYSLDIATSAVRRLTTVAANDGLPVWSPDGRYIAFVSDREGFWGIWTMYANGTGQQLLTRLPGSVDGTVEFEQEYLTNGWLEEQIAWSR
jgi:Tol biopolymer transport system component